MFSGAPEEHIDHVRHVLTLLNNAGVTLKLKKFTFFMDTIDYLGHVIRLKRLEIANHTAEAIHGLRPPTSLTELRSFLGLFNVSRRFVPKFARLAAPLNKRLRKDQPFTFGPLNREEMATLDVLKNALIFSPILAPHNSSGNITLDTDACDVQIGCVLLQKQANDTTRRIVYWSRSVKDAERRYDTTRRECLAIVWSVPLLRSYLEGNRFTI